MVEKVISVKADLKQAQKEFERLTKTIEEQKKITNEFEQEVVVLEQKLKSTPKNALSAQKKLKDQIGKTKDAIKENRVAIKGLSQEQKRAKKVVSSLTEENKKSAGSLDGINSAADRFTGGAASKFKAVQTGLKGVALGFKGIGTAIAASGIGLLALIIASVVTAFKSSEEGQNKFAKLMGIIGTVTGNFLDLLADLGEKVISVFENPKKAIKDFANLIKENIINRFEGLIELIPQLGKAVSALFKGNFLEAGEIAANAVAKVSLGVEDVTGKLKAAANAVKDFAKEQVKEGNIAAKIANMRAEATKKERALITERAEADRKIAELREKAADKENFSAEERIKAILEAGKLNEEITNKEIETARLRFEAKKAENELSRSTIEDKDEEARLEARLIELETARLKKQKSLTAEVTTARREAATERKAIETEEAARQKAINDKRIALDKMVADSQIKTAEDKAILDKERALKEIEVLDATETEKGELRRDTAAFYDAQIAEARKKDKKKEDEDLERRKKELAGFREAARDAVALSEGDQEDLEVIKTEEKYNRLIELATKFGEDTAVLEAAKEQATADLKEGFALRKVDQEQAIEDARKAIREDSLNHLIGIAGAETDIGKALLLAKQAIRAQELIDGIKSKITAAKEASEKATIRGAEATADIAAGSAKAASILPPPFNIPTIIAYAAQAFSIISSVRKAVSAAKGRVSGISAKSPASRIPAKRELKSIPPSFNVVGASQTNQIADAVGNRLGGNLVEGLGGKIEGQTTSLQQQPIKTYVVAKDVSSAQELDNNIIGDSGLG